MINFDILFKRVVKMQSNFVSFFDMKLYVKQLNCYVILTKARRIIST